MADATAGNAGNTGDWTVRKVLEWTTGHLKKHGSGTPRLDAEVLLAHARKCLRIQLYTQYDEVLSDEVRGVMRDLVQRRAQHEPVAYLVGEREFFSLPFFVSRDVLIPRPDTETLVIQVVECLKPMPTEDGTVPPAENVRIADLCTGSGCVAVAIATQWPSASVVATDLSEKALAVAKSNIDRHGLAARIELRQGSLLDPLKSLPPFHVIASNPPYIPKAEIETLDPDVRRHEPHLALDGGVEGLDCLRPLIEQGANHLLPAGWMLLEFTPEQAAKLVSIAEASGHWSHIEVVKDLGQTPRILKLRKKS